MEKKQKKDLHKVNWPILFLILVLGIGICVPWYFMKPLMLLLYPDIANGGDIGKVGDSYGVLTSLYTGLAFAGVIVTIILQSQELALQRKELKDTRAEFKQQNRTLKYQRFENTFFNLVDQYRSLGKSHFSAKVGSITSVLVKPNLSFTMMRHDYNNRIHASSDGKTAISISDSVQDELGAHIKTFERLVEFIYANKKAHMSRMKYLRFFFAQLTNFELILFFYHFNLREIGPPQAFDDYFSELFGALHTSPVMPTGHFVTIVNKSL